MKTVSVALDNGKIEIVEVPDTGDDLYDEAVALLQVVGANHLKTRGHIDRVCGNIARRFVSDDIGADPLRWRDWQRKIGIKTSKNAKSIFQPVLKAMSGKAADTTGFISQAAHAMTEWDQVYRDPQPSNDPDRPMPERVEADRVANWMTELGGYAKVYKLRGERLKLLNPQPSKEARKADFRKLVEDCHPLHSFRGLGDALRQYDGYYCPLIQIDPRADTLTIVAPGEQPDQGWLERNSGRLINTLPRQCLPLADANGPGVAVPSADEAAVEGRGNAETTARQDGGTTGADPTQHVGDGLAPPDETAAVEGTPGIRDAEVTPRAAPPDRQLPDLSLATEASTDDPVCRFQVSSGHTSTRTPTPPICKLKQCRGYAMCSTVRCGASDTDPEAKCRPTPSSPIMGSNFVMVDKTR